MTISTAHPGSRLKDLTSFLLRESASASTWARQVARLEMPAGNFTVWSTVGGRNADDDDDDDDALLSGAR